MGLNNRKMKSSTLHERRSELQNQKNWKKLRKTANEKYRTREEAKLARRKKFRRPI